MMILPALCQRALKVQTTAILTAGTASVVVMDPMPIQTVASDTSLLAVLVRVLVELLGVMTMRMLSFQSARCCHPQEQMIRNQFAPIGHKRMAASSQSRVTDSS